MTTRANQKTYPPVDNNRLGIVASLRNAAMSMRTLPHVPLASDQALMDLAADEIESTREQLLRALEMLKLEARLHRENHRHGAAKALEEFVVRTAARAGIEQTA